MTSLVYSSLVVDWSLNRDILSPSKLLRIMRSSKVWLEKERVTVISIN